MVGLGRHVLLSILAVWIVFISSYSSATNADVQPDGTTSFTTSEEGLVTFTNNYKDKAIHLFWEGGDGSIVKMAALPKGGSAELNTFLDHTFFATFDAEANQRVNPRQVSYLHGPILFY